MKDMQSLDGCFDDLKNGSWKALVDLIKEQVDDEADHTDEGRGVTYNEYRKMYKE